MMFRPLWPPWPPPSLNFATPGEGDPARHERPEFRPAEYGKIRPLRQLLTTEIHERGGYPAGEHLPLPA